LSVDEVGQASFQGAHGLPAGLSGGAFAVVVGASFGVVAELAVGHDVQDPVDAPVPGPGQPVVGVVTGGHVDGCASTGFTIGEQPLGRVPADPVATLDRPHPVRVTPSAASIA
jgi:hypothetical protein